MSDTIPMIVDGKPFPSQSTFPVYDPQDRTTVLHNVSSLGLSSVAEVVASSKKALPGWRNTSIAERRKIFAKAASLLQLRLGELIGTQATETTSSAGFAGFDVAILSTECLDETSAAMSTALRGEMAPLDATGKRMMVIKEPMGVVLSIAPWNAPSTLAMRAIVNPLAGGNVVILKTSEFSPKTHLGIAKLFHDAGLPDGVLNVIHVSTKDAPQVTTALIEEEAVRKINFTGSTRVGRMLAQTCAANLKPITLELGGKAPVVVCDDADIDLAANNIIFGGLMNQGQICMATANIIAHSSIVSKLERALATLIKENPTLRADSKMNTAPNPEGTDHRLRGLFTPSAADRVKSLYDDAVSNGGKVVAGESGFDLKLGVVQPVFVRASEKMRIFKEEAFAPIIGIFEYNTEEEAIEKANAPGVGLSSAVFSTNETKAFRIARGLESGAVHINGITVHDDQGVPHGGVKSSGAGRFNGRWGIEEFCYLKTVTVTPGVKYPFFVM
ncbi:hypothetical protein CBS101457_006649 [Exobasidium rhododendri]|nr:hypothetical protein CBS101457_006649 [Exobasidium rhododendri]